MMENKIVIFSNQKYQPKSWYFGILLLIMSARASINLYNMDKKAQTIDTYNKIAHSMAQRFNELGARIPDIEKTFSCIARRNPKVLEIGCGNGRDAAEILKCTDDYVGIDISESMIRLAKERVPQGTFVVADIENCDFPQNIDIIFSFASLLHSPKEKVKIILNEAYEALNPGGVFFISLKYGEYGEEAKTDEFGTRTFYFYAPDLLKELAGDRYATVFLDEYEFGEQKWFRIILQK